MDEEPDSYKVPLLSFLSSSYIVPSGERIALVIFIFLSLTYAITTCVTFCRISETSVNSVVVATVVSVDGSRVIENFYGILYKFLNQNPRLIGESGNVKVLVPMHYFFLRWRNLNSP